MSDKTKTALDIFIEGLDEIRWVSYAANCKIERGKIADLIKKTKALEKEQMCEFSREYMKSSFDGFLEDFYDEKHGSEGEID